MNRYIRKRSSSDSPVPTATGGAERKFVKAKALAAAVNVCPKTIFRLAEAGKITAYRINQRLVLFDPPNCFRMD